MKRWIGSEVQGKRYGRIIDIFRLSDERVYCLLLSLYVAIFIFLELAWTKRVEPTFNVVRITAVSLMMWGAAIYIFFSVVRAFGLNRKILPMAVLGAGLIGLTIWFTQWMSTNAYTVVMDVYFCLFACGKNYKRMLKCILSVVLVGLILAALFIPLGITVDVQKPENVSPGHSIGVIYPNDWGYIAFLGMMIAWYLYLRHKPLVTFPIFWGMAAFMYYYISCRTIALLSVVFPIPALLVHLLEKHRANRPSGGSEKVGVFGWIITAMPFLVFAFVLYVSYHYEWVHLHFYHTALHNLAMRFVQGGLYFVIYGLPVFGNPYRANDRSWILVNGTYEEVGILDSSFAAYSIMRGLFWIAYTLTWLSIAIHKAIRHRDYAIPFLCGIILVFAMIERPGLDLWYNFILLYPLALVAGTKDAPAPAAAPDPEASELEAPADPTPSDAIPAETTEAEATTADPE